MDRLTEATLRQEELLRQVLPEVQKTETVKRLFKTQKAVKSEARELLSEMGL
tara:strand:+ start:438 stop:593 length:156 start_codon:yes stop_codon:yes gene_type:complete